MPLPIKSKDLKLKPEDWRAIRTMSIEDRVARLEVEVERNSIAIAQTVDSLGKLIEHLRRSSESSFF